jgi:glycosyltransferase involved in cell wall biosynthesis
MTPTISAIIIARNEEAMIANCLDTLQWCNEVIVVNHGSGDATVSIAHKAGARVVSEGGTFAQLRNHGLERAKTDWVLYIDADERVTPALSEEILLFVSQTTATHAVLSRTNVVYGQPVNHGGWERDAVVRLFSRAYLQKWEGEIHEHAVVSGDGVLLKQPLIHFTHRSVVESLLKSAEWTPIEAKLLNESGVSPVTGWTLLRKGIMEVWRRLVLWGGYQDGVVGWIESLTQGINRMLVYMQVWELQQKPSISEQYHHHEQAIAKLWQRHRSAS